MFWKVIHNMKASKLKPAKKWKAKKKVKDYRLGLRIAPDMRKDLEAEALRLGLNLSEVVLICISETLPALRGKDVKVQLRPVRV